MHLDTFFFKVINKKIFFKVINENYTLQFSAINDYWILIILFEIIFLKNLL